MLIRILILFIAFGSIGLLAYQFLSPFIEKVQARHERKAKEDAERLSRMFVKVKVNKLAYIYSLGPFILGVLGYFIMGNLIGVLAGGIIGWMMPAIIVKNVEIQRKRKFSQQLIDGLIMLSSALKGGLSLLQSIEVLVEEMPAPISQEFGIVLGENKMGVPLSESFEHLNKRIGSDEMRLMTTAILLARETGGNLPVVFARLVSTIRENNKILESINTLTLQGKIQGIVMSLIPVVFTCIVFSFNPNFFDIMLSTDIGRFLLGYCVISQIIGIMLIHKVSRIEA